MATTDAQIHWFAIINSFIILIFITSMVAVIIMRTLNRDISMYNDEDIEVNTGVLNVRTCALYWDERI
jgi:transmembrane 9 superfamily protein 2/4